MGQQRCSECGEYPDHAPTCSKTPITQELLKRYCDNARAYGWEVGRLHTLNPNHELKAQYESHHDNPFTDPNWDKDLMVPPGFLVTARENTL